MKLTLGKKTEKEILKVDAIPVARKEREPLPLTELAHGGMIEMVERRGATRKVFTNGKGTQTAVIYDKPVHYYDAASKQFEEVDTELIDSGENFETHKCPHKVRFKKQPKDGRLFEIEKGRCKVRMVSHDVTGCNCKTENCGCKDGNHRDNVMLVKGVKKGADLEYVVDSEKVKENIVINECADEYEFRFAVEFENAFVDISSDGKKLLLKGKETGKTEYFIPAPFMIDAKGEMSDAVYYEIYQQLPDSVELKVVADKEWINAENRALPVKIDPQIVVDGAVGGYEYDNAYSSYDGERFFRYQTLHDGKVVGDALYLSYGDNYYGYPKDYECRLIIAKEKLLSSLPGLKNKNQIKSVRFTCQSTSDSYVNEFVMEVDSDNCVDIYPGDITSYEMDLTSVFINKQGDVVINFLNRTFRGDSYEKHMRFVRPEIKVEYEVEKVEYYLNGRPDKLVYHSGEYFDPTGLSIIGIHEDEYEQEVTQYSISPNGPLSKDVNKVTVTVNEVLPWSVDFDIRVVPVGEFYNDTTNYHGSYLSSDVELDLEHNEKVFFVAGGAHVSVNLLSGKAVPFIPELSVENSPIKVEVAHVYTGDYSDYYGCGKGWQLNLHEILELNDDGKFSYTDGFGKQHFCENVYYYLDASNKKQIINNHSYITIDFDGEMTYNGHKVFKESCTHTGLTFSGAYDKNCKFINIKYFEQRIDEQKQLEEQIASYENFFKSYKIVDNSFGAVHELKSSYKSNFEWFILQTNYYSYCVTESERLNLKSLSQQKQDYESDGKIEGSEDYKHKDKINLCIEQMQQYADKKQETVEQLEKYYKEYVNAKFKLEELNRQLPTYYASDGTVVKAFNKFGRLVAICDAYENAVVIGYDDDNDITGLYCNDKPEIIFEYNYNKQLISMADGRGRKISYHYAGEILDKITYCDGSFVDIVYNKASATKCISKIQNSNGLKSEFSYTQSPVKLQSITDYCNGNNLSTLKFDYYSGKTTVGDEFNREEFCYSDNQMTGYLQVQNGLVVQAEKYSYTKNKNKIIQRADPKSLNRHSQADFEFVAKERAEITLNSFDLPVTRTETGLDNGDGITKKVTHYYYDNDRRIVKAEVACYGSSGTALYTAVSESVYDVYGNVAREESYVSGEEETKGKQITEHFYDDKGREVKSCSYNSLDTGSKFYTRSDYDEQGKQVASYDETGENPVKYEYKNGTQTVQTEIYPNGGKLSYGYDVDGTVTGITQSTAEGEENSTRKVYKNGKPVKLESGNTTVEYAYDYKGRTTEIKLNGKVYQTFEYRDKVTQGDKIVDVVTMTNANGETFESTVDSYGNVISVKQGSQIVTTAKYNKNGDALEVYDGITGIKESNLYDGYGRLNNHTSGGITDSLIYDGNGKVSRAILGGREYRYEYDTDAAKTLKRVKTDGFAFVPQTDKLGRNTGREISGASGKIASEHISYRKVGDHATNMPGTVWYGGRKNGAYAITENIRYKYDSCGNISEILENGVTVTRYEYDTIGRIIREDNKPLGKTVTYNYDGNGNITDKRVYEYTLKKELGEPKDEKIYSYNGDQLISYGEETFVYDKIGNPTIYRDRDLEWSNGRQLKSFSAMPFNYDGKGRRISKGDISFTYDVNGRLVKQSNGLEFIYDNSGITALKYGNVYYFYRKDAQGNIIALIDSNGNKVVQYIYDAWGNHSISGDEVLGNLNPFRYRSYYYDTETGLYYLQTRYYDPETGRFISQDSIEYADPESINGLNLYAYCGNNPVMRVDPTGTDYLSTSQIIDIISAVFELGIGGGLALVGWAYKTGVRPSNIGIGIYNKQVNKAICSLSKASNVLSKISTGMAVVSTIISVVDCINTDIKRGYSVDRVVSNAVTNTVIYGGLAFGIGAMGGKIGSILGSVVPGLGNVIGAAVGFAVGVAVGFLLDLQINGKSIIDHIRDGVHSFWKWLFGGI